MHLLPLQIPIIFWLGNRHHCIDWLLIRFGFYDTSYYWTTFGLYVGTPHKLASTKFWKPQKGEKRKFQNQITLFSIFFKKLTESSLIFVLVSRTELFRSYCVRYENKVIYFWDFLTFTTDDYITFFFFRQIELFILKVNGHFPARYRLLLGSHFTFSTNCRVSKSSTMWPNSDVARTSDCFA
jgi:hypothetical protein